MSARKQNVIQPGKMKCIDVISWDFLLTFPETGIQAG